MPRPTTSLISVCVVTECLPNSSLLVGNPADATSG
jgi:hypothetical protein